MTHHHTHLCLVSDQATPNLLPVLDAKWQPRRVVLACSEKMVAKAEAIKAVLKTKVQGVQVETLNLPDAFDYSSLSNTFLDYLAAHTDEDVALNVTGGTKLMAVAAQEVFRSEKKPVFYVNVENDEVITLGRSSHSQPLSAKLNVEEMLRAHGYSVTGGERPQVTAAQRDLTARLVDHVESAGPALGILNALASAAKGKPGLAVDLSDQQRDSRSLDEILSLLADAKLLQRKAHSFVFAHEDARKFANGGWLEYHVYEALQSLRGKQSGLSDVVLGLRIGFGQGGQREKDKNEIDVSFLFRNTLHFIECKTANLAQPGGSGDDKATEAIYKMESLRKYGGLRTKGMIVDYRGQLSKFQANLQRAKDAHIEILAGRQLKSLKDHIQRLWLTS